MLGLKRRQWRVLLQLAGREVWVEHAGKLLGRFWGVFQPLFLLAIYAFVYGVVFHARGALVPGVHNYTVYLLAGLVPWFAFQLSMTRAPNAITNNATLVTDVIFDVQLLPLAIALAACVTLGLGLGFVIVYRLAVVHTIPVLILALPLLVLLELGAMSGVALALASIGTFLKDVRDVVQMSSLLLVFITPILYLPHAVPSLFRPVLWVNPLTWMVYCFQDVLVYGRFAHPAAWAAFAAGSGAVLVGGYRLFGALRSHFADVL